MHACTIGCNYSMHTLTVSLDTISIVILMCGIGIEEIGNREATVHVTRQEAIHDCSIIKFQKLIFTVKHKTYISLYMCNTNHLLT